MLHRIPVREGVIQGSAALQWFERYDIINFIALSRLCRMPAGRRFIRNDSGPPERKEAAVSYTHLSLLAVVAGQCSGHLLRQKASVTPDSLGAALLVLMGLIRLAGQAT